MNKIYFITSNEGKIKSLQAQFSTNDIDIEIEGVNLDIIEPQADNVKEVSLLKAKEAFKALKKPLIVEDGGFEIAALNGFPGVYTKYALKSLGIDGILNAMSGVEDRSCRFVSCTTFMDSKGNHHQFERMGGEGLMTTEKSTIESKMAWSDIWYVFYVPQLGKVLSEASEEEVLGWWQDKDQKNSISVFVDWLKSKN